MSKVVATKKKETLIIARRFMEVLPMLIPLEKVKLNVIDVWMEQSLGYDERNKHKIRTKVSEAVNKWGVQWVREAFEWCEVEGKHPKQFWKEVDEGPSFEERMLEGKI